MHFTVSQWEPEDAVIQSDTESALQATSVTAQVKHTESWGEANGHWSMGLTGNRRARACVIRQ